MGWRLPAVRTAAMTFLCGCPSLSPRVGEVVAVVGRQWVDEAGAEAFTEPLPADLSGFELRFSTLMNDASVEGGISLLDGTGVAWPITVETSTLFARNYGYHVGWDGALPPGPDYELVIAATIDGLQEKPLENPRTIGFVVDSAVWDGTGYD